MEEARKFADETFFEKNPIEELAELAENPKKDDKSKSPSDLKFMDDPVTYVKEKLDLFLTIAQKDPIEAIKFVPEAAGGIAAVVVALLAAVGLAFSSGSSPVPAAKKVASDAKDKAAAAQDKVSEAVASGAEAIKGEVKKRTQS